MHGLVGDLWPNIRLMQLTGHWILEYREDNGGMMRLLRVIYCWMVSFIITSQFAFVGLFLLLETYDPDQMAAATITLLFFAHSITKFGYFAARSKLFYRTLSAWNQVL